MTRRTYDCQEYEGLLGASVFISGGNSDKYPIHLCRNLCGAFSTKKDRI